MMKPQINLITIWTNNVDESFVQLVKLGAIPIHKPQNMPWNQRTALFADPDGNIHEIYADIK